MRRTIFLLFYLFTLLLFSACKTKTVIVPSVREVYKTRTDTVLRVDSVSMHDSITVFMRADTVFKTAWKTRETFKFIYKNRVDTLLRTDSVRVPVPVAATLTKTQRRLISIGRATVIILALAIITAAVWLAIRLRRKTGLMG